MKKFYLFVFLLIIFSFGIYFFKNFFLGTFESNFNNHIENNYIEPSINELNVNAKSSIQNTFIEDEQIETGSSLVSGKEKGKFNGVYYFIYFPYSYRLVITDYKNILTTFLTSKLVNEKFDSLIVEFIKEKIDVRGKMKNSRIKLYGVSDLSIGEFLAVGIHEFGHYIDLYFLKKNIITDTSDYFYNISWNGVNVIKPGLVGEDFVSGYAMTNKYEDFAETFTYYILHNKDFLEKSKKSKILKNKYDFMNKYVFVESNLKGTNFANSGNMSLPYYRDITKIEFSLQNFLEFLEK